MRKSSLLLIFVAAVAFLLIYSASRNRRGSFPVEPAAQAGTVSAGPAAHADNKPVLEQIIGTASPGPVEDGKPEESTCNMHEIGIPVPIGAALKKWDADFVVWRSTEYNPLLCVNITTSPVFALNAGLGDFNDDGMQDAVVAGHNKQDELLVAVLSQKTGDYKAVPLCTSDVYGKTPLEAASCNILGKVNYGLKQFPQAAIYRILPKGTRIEVSIGSSNPYISNLKSEAFIAGLSQDFSHPRSDYKSPFMAVQLFYWNWDFKNGTYKGRDRSKTYRGWDRKEVIDDGWDWLNTPKGFVAWNIDSINYRDWEFNGLAIGS